MIAFDRAGQGEPVILVGGALTQRASPQAAGIVPPLSGRFTVYNYDRRGRGDSGDTPPYTVAREVEDIDALVQEAGGSAFMFSASSGGALAQRTTLHPEGPGSRRRPGCRRVGDGRVLFRLRLLGAPRRTARPETRRSPDVRNGLRSGHLGVSWTPAPTITPGQSATLILHGGREA